MKGAKKCTWRCVHPVQANGYIAMAVNDEDGKPIRFELPVEDAKQIALCLMGFLPPSLLSRQECLKFLGRYHKQAKTSDRP